jgi:hypothetical protein
MRECEFDVSATTKKSDPRRVPCGQPTYGAERRCEYHRKLDAGLLTNSNGERFAPEPSPRRERDAFLAAAAPG